VDLQAAWYLPPVRGPRTPQPRTPQQLTAIRPGGYIASMRSRLRSALPDAEAHERLSLGVSYDRLFTRVSRDIHFTPSARERDADVEEVSLGLDECGILGLDVLLAVMQLLGEDGGPRCRQVKRIFERNAYPGELSERITRGTANPGDFVLAYGDLAEVIEVAESDFGYVSYKVLYLAGSPLPDLPEDWLPAQTVRVLFSRDLLLEQVSDLVEQGDLPEDFAKRLTSAAGREHFRASVKEFWNRGLRDYVLGR
jgi:hypothetical protein